MMGRVPLEAVVARLGVNHSQSTVMVPGPCRTRLKTCCGDDVVLKASHQVQHKSRSALVVEHPEIQSE